MSFNLLDRIAEECSEFLLNSKGQPLVKTLKKNTANFRKVKVRTKFQKNDFIEAFNEAFEEEYRNIYGRSIFCNGDHSVEYSDEYEKVYVIPTNGFRYLYNPNITFIEEYKKIYEKLSCRMSEANAESLFVDMIEYSYKNNTSSFAEASFSQKEIIIYGIPYYYAVKVNKFPSYSDLISVLKT